MDPASIAMMLAALARLSGAVAGAYATAAAGNELSDDEKAAIDAAGAVAAYEQDAAVAAAIARATAAARPAATPGPRRLSELRSRPDDLGDPNA